MATRIRSRIPRGRRGGLAVGWGDDREAVQQVEEALLLQRLGQIAVHQHQIEGARDHRVPCGESVLARMHLEPCLLEQADGQLAVYRAALRRGRRGPLLPGTLPLMSPEKRLIDYAACSG
ncbi:MAG: hypothetical protein ACPGQD_05980 [Planctomycetota bacterium]